MKVLLYALGKAFNDIINNRSFLKQCVWGNGIEVVAVSDRIDKGGHIYNIGGREVPFCNVDKIPENSYDKILVTSDRFFKDISLDLSNRGIDITKIEQFDSFINDSLFKKSLKYNISLVLIIKNEACYLAEWIEYHRLIGVEHFYIYDDASSDNLFEVLQPYINARIVTYVKWKHTDGQSEAYFDAVKKFRNETTYMGFVDIDEFIVLKEKKKIYDVVEDIRNGYECNSYRKGDVHFGGVGINFRYYGNSGYIKKPNGLVIENFLYRALDRHIDHSFIKTIANPKTVLSCDVHFMHYVPGYICVSENGSYIPDSNFFDARYDKIWINHYWCKSDEEMKKKFMRGWIAGFRTSMDVNLREKIFEQELAKTKEFNDVYDPVLLQYAETIKINIKNNIKI